LRKQVADDDDFQIFILGVDQTLLQQQRYARRLLRFAIPECASFTLLAGAHRPVRSER
jgi:hypothetical protein